MSAPTTRPAVVRIDRIVSIVLGVGLVAGGLALLDWQGGWTGKITGTISTTAVIDARDAAWWPWAAGAGGVVVGLVGLVWLLLHVPTRRTKVARLATLGSPDGSISVDLSSVADAVAREVERSTTIYDVDGAVHAAGAVQVVEVRGRIDALSGAGDVMAAARSADEQLERSFPTTPTRCRVLIGHPGRRSAAREKSAELDA